MKNDNSQKVDAEDQEAQERLKNLLSNNPSNPMEIEEPPQKLTQTINQISNTVNSERLSVNNQSRNNNQSNWQGSQQVIQQNLYVRVPSGQGLIVDKQKLSVGIAPPQLTVEQQKMKQWVDKKINELEKEVDLFDSFSKLHNKVRDQMSQDDWQKYLKNFNKNGSLGALNGPLANQDNTKRSNLIKELKELSTNAANDPNILDNPEKKNKLMDKYYAEEQNKAISKVLHGESVKQQIAQQLMLTTQDLELDNFRDEIANPASKVGKIIMELQEVKDAIKSVNDKKNADREEPIIEEPIFVGQPIFIGQPIPQHQQQYQQQQFPQQQPQFLQEPSPRKPKKIPAPDDPTMFINGIENIENQRKIHLKDFLKVNSDALVEAIKQCTPPPVDIDKIKQDAQTLIHNPSLDALDEYLIDEEKVQQKLYELNPSLKSAIDNIAFEGQKRLYEPYRRPKLKWKKGVHEHKDKDGNTICTVRKGKTQEQEINGKKCKFRTVEFPKKLDSDGPVQMSFSLFENSSKLSIPPDPTARKVNKNPGVYFVVDYNKEGKVSNVSCPQPVKFSGGTPNMAYVEKDGKTYTLPVTKEKYTELMKAQFKTHSQAKDTIRQGVDIAAGVQQDQNIPQGQALDNKVYQGEVVQQENLSQNQQVVFGTQYIPSLDNSKVLEGMDASGIQTEGLVVATGQQIPKGEPLTVQALQQYQKMRQSFSQQNQNIVEAQQRLRSQSLDFSNTKSLQDSAQR